MSHNHPLYQDKRGFESGFYLECHGVNVVRVTFEDSHCVTLAQISRVDPDVVVSAPSGESEKFGG